MDVTAAQYEAWHSAVRLDTPAPRGLRLGVLRPLDPVLDPDAVRFVAWADDEPVAECTLAEGGYMIVRWADAARLGPRLSAWVVHDGVPRNLPDLLTIWYQWISIAVRGADEVRRAIDAARWEGPRHVPSVRVWREGGTVRLKVWNRSLRRWDGHRMPPQPPVYDGHAVLPVLETYQEP